MNVDANTNLLSVPMDTLQHSILGDLPLDAKKNTEQCNSFFKLLSCRLFSYLFFFLVDYCSLFLL